MLLYALLYLLGYEDMTIDELKGFRQWGSRTAGHPELGHAAGIETTTGPLGQGLANAVGMAIAENHLAAEFGSRFVDHRTYVLAGDGCLMEGISQEAIALAGHLKLAKLVVLWDDNGISIDGSLALADSTDQLQRFAASGWRVTRIDGHDSEAVAAALTAAQTATVPSLIACKTIIGYGAPGKQGTAATHGSPLGPEEVVAARERLGWHHPPFVVPDHVVEEWRAAGARGTALRAEWEQRVVASPAAVRDEFARRVDGVLPAALDDALRAYKTELSKVPGAVATRNASQNMLEIVNAAVPETIGGSADLTGSNNTQTKGLKPLTAHDATGRYIHYGIREHAMAAAMNGMAVHGGVIPYGGTFLTFTDYCRPAIRLSAIMRLRVIYVMTHDSIGLGEDGPTHQPIEHLAALRAIPNLLVLRPCDAVETAECWEIALKSKDAPSILALTRQKLKPARLTFRSEEPLPARGIRNPVRRWKIKSGNFCLRLGGRNRSDRAARARSAGHSHARRVCSLHGIVRTAVARLPRPDTRRRKGSGGGGSRSQPGMAALHRRRRFVCRHVGFWRERAFRDSLPGVRPYAGSSREGSAKISVEESPAQRPQSPADRESAQLAVVQDH